MIINRSIEMIAHNKTDGSIRSIRFRMMEEDELQVIYVDKVFTSRVEKIDCKLTYVFNCMVAPHGVNHMCEIRYDLASTKWGVVQDVDFETYNPKIACIV